MNPSDLPAFTPSTSEPAVAPDGSRDRRIDALLASLKTAEDAYDRAATEFANLTIDRELASDRGFDAALRTFAGKYLTELEKAEAKYTRAEKRFEQEGLAALTDAELARDQFGRDAGANPPLIVGQIFDAVAGGKLVQLADDTFLAPMVQAALADQYQVPPVAPVWVPDAPPIGDTLLSPPIPAEDVGLPPLVPPPPGDTPVSPPGDIPVSPPGLQFCPPLPPGLEGQGLIQRGPGEAVPPGYTPVIQNGNCTVYRPPGVRPPPPPPPPPAADPCRPPETVQVGCVTIPYPWVSKYWYVTSCADGCTTKVCTFYGPSAPPVGPGETLHGPFDAALDGTELQQFARLECVRQGTAPPLAPPTAPPPPEPPGPDPQPKPGPEPEPPPPGQPPLPGDVKTPPGLDELLRLCAEARSWVDAANGGAAGTTGSIWADDFGKKLFKRGGGGVSDLIANFLDGVVSTAFGSFNGVFERLGVPSATAEARIMPALGVFGWLERITGAPVSYLGEQWAQYMRFAAPLFLPSQDSLNSQYLAGVIGEESWECLTKFNGNVPSHARRTVEAGRVRPGVLDTISLFRRGVIDRPEYVRRMRELGVLRGEDRVAFEKASELTPQVSDIFRYIKKDVTNKEFVELGQLDEGFAEAYSGEVRAFGDAIGLSETQAKYEYRAEWEFPSRTEATEMFRRLRPGRPTTITQTQPDGTTKSVTAPPFTIDDYLQVLKVNDVAPGFRERALAVSYVPVNLTEIKALHKNGVIDRAEVVERLQDIGKSPADSVVLADLVERDNARMLSNETGGWTRRKVFKEYRDGMISRVVAAEILARTIPDKRTIDNILSDAELDREVSTRRECVAGVKRRYFTAEIDDQRALFEMTNLGMTEDSATVILDGWRCKRSSRSKEPRVEYLKKWWAQGIITTPQLYDRLLRLGYTADDALRIARSTEQQSAEARAKEAAAQAAKAKREAEAKARRERAEQRQRLRDAARRQTQDQGGPDEKV